ncbi:MAG: four helix bundle protein [Planctomycetota bacterium]|nr:MAG: four helix bundle protein [Planctomycetota bacterium]
MANEEDFRELIVWRKAIEMTKNVYRITQRLPDSERFGMMSQMRRAAVSVPSNIAEGNARETVKDYLKFLVTARGSLAEVETQFIIATELKMLDDTAFVLAAINEVKRILQGLILSLRRRMRGK